MVRNCSLPRWLGSNKVHNGRMCGYKREVSIFIWKDMVYDDLLIQVFKQLVLLTKLTVDGFCLCSGTMMCTVSSGVHKEQSAHN